MNFLQKIALRALRPQLPDVGIILAAICSLQRQVEDDLKQAIANDKLVLFRSRYYCGSMETGRFFVEVVPDLEHDGRWLNLYVACKNPAVLVMVAHALAEPVYFFASDAARFDGPNRFRGCIYGAPGKLVDDYRAMLRAHS